MRDVSADDCLSTIHVYQQLTAYQPLPEYGTLFQASVTVQIMPPLQPSASCARQDADHG